jgi:hypothetical protein
MNELIIGALIELLRVAGVENEKILRFIFSGLKGLDAAFADEDWANLTEDELQIPDMSLDEYRRQVAQKYGLPIPS